MNIPQKCNNPVNIMIAAPVGEATGVFRPRDDMHIGYAQFPTPQAGWRAAHRQYDSDVKRGLTIRQYIFKFAPPNENNTNAYLDFVCKEMRVAPDALLSSVSKYALAGVQAAEEGYYNV